MKRKRLLSALVIGALVGAMAIGTVNSANASDIQIDGSTGKGNDGPWYSGVMNDGYGTDVHTWNGESGTRNYEDWAGSKTSDTISLSGSGSLTLNKDIGSHHGRLYASDGSLATGANITLTSGDYIYAAVDLAVNGGTLTISGAEAYLNGDDRVSGTINMTSGTLGLNGFSSGDDGGTISASGGTLTMSGNNTLNDKTVIGNAVNFAVMGGNQTFDDAGSILTSFNNAGNLTFNGGTLGSSITITNKADRDIYFVGANNDGSIKKDAGNSNVIIKDSSTNSGTIEAKNLYIGENSTSTGNFTNNGSIKTTADIEVRSNSSFENKSGKSLTIGGSLTTQSGATTTIGNAGDVSLTGDYNNAGTLVFQGGTIANAIKGITSGIATTYGDLETANGVSIGNVTIDVDDLTIAGTLTNGGTLTINGGTVAYNTAANILNTNKIIFKGGNATTSATNAVAIAGDSGIIEINGYINSSKAISAGDVIITGGKLTIAANALTDVNDKSVLNDSILELTGGTSLDNPVTHVNAVTGSGKIVINGFVSQTEGKSLTSTSNDADAISIDLGKGLIINASDLDAKTTNAGTLVLNGGQLDYAVTGSGATSIIGEVINASTITQSTGGVSITGSGKLTTDASNVTATITNDVSDGLILTGGTNKNTIQKSGDTGSVKINATTGTKTVTNEGNIQQDVNVIAGTFDNTTGSVTGLTTVNNVAAAKQSGSGSLTSVDNAGTFSVSAGSVTNIKNTGTVNYTGGSITNYTQSVGNLNISDGAILTINGNDNPLTGEKNVIKGGTIRLGSTGVSPEPDTAGSLIFNNGIVNTAEIITIGSAANSLTVGDTDGTKLTLTGNSDIVQSTVVTINSGSELAISSTSADGVVLNGDSTTPASNDNWSGTVSQTGGVLHVTGYNDSDNKNGTINVTGGEFDVDDGVLTVDTGSTIKSGNSNAKVVIAEGTTLDITGGNVTLDGGDATGGHEDHDQVVWDGIVHLNGDNAHLTLANIYDVSRDTTETKNKSATGVLNAENGYLTIDAATVLLGAQDVIKDAVKITLNSDNIYVGTGETSDTTDVYIGTDDTWHGAINLMNSGTLTLDGTTTAVNSETPANSNSLNAQGGTLYLVNTGTTGHGSATGVTFGNTSDKIMYAVNTTLGSTSTSGDLEAADLNINAGQIQLDDADNLIAGVISLGTTDAGVGELDLAGVTTGKSDAKDVRLNAQNGTLVIGSNTTSGKTTELAYNDGSTTIGDTIAKAVRTTIDAGSTLKINSDNANVTLNDISAIPSLADDDYWTGNVELAAGNLTLDNVIKTTTSTPVSTYNQSGGVLNLEGSSLDIATSNSKITAGEVNINNASALTLENGSANSAKVVMTDGTASELNILDANSELTTLADTNLATGTINLGDGSNTSKLNLANNSIIAQVAELNIANASELNISDTASAIIDNATDTYAGDVNLKGGSLEMRDLTITTGTTPTSSGGDLPYYKQEGGALTLTKTTLSMKDATLINAPSGSMTLDTDSHFESQSGRFIVGDLQNAGVIHSINTGYENHLFDKHIIGDGAGDEKGEYTIDLYARSNTNKNYDQFGKDTTTISATDLTTKHGIIHVSDWTLNGDIYGYDAPIDRSIAIDKLFKGSVANNHVIDFTSTDKEVFTPIGWYGLHSKGGGNYSFDLNRYNPGVFRGQVTTLAQYQNQLAIDDMIFNHTMVDQGFKGNDYIASNPNRLASANDLYPPYQYSRKDGGLWVKMYGNFERLHAGGLDVGNNAYGTIIGADFGLKELKHGWQFMPTAFIGYNGAHQYWNGYGAYQNGGQLGVMGTWYKNDFMIGAMAYGGVYGNQMSTPRGDDNAFNYFAGSAVKGAYNWKFAKNWALQPNLFVSYNYFGQQNWHSDFGQMGMMSGSLNGINIAPGLNLIYERETWSAYVTLQYMYNINQATGGRAGNVDLPRLSMDRGYLQYGIGVNKTFSDRFSAYLQAVIRNVGRNGIGLQAGFQWRLGKGSSGGKLKKTNVTPEPKKTEIILSGDKIQ